MFLDDTARDDVGVFDPVFSYWLHAVDVLAGGSPVLIFKNKDRSKPLAIREITELFPNVDDTTFASDLAREESEEVAALRDRIERKVQILEHVGQTIPKFWLDVHERLQSEAERSSVISFEEFQQLCAECGVGAEEDDPGLAIDQRAANNQVLAREVAEQLQQLITDYEKRKGLAEFSGLCLRHDTDGQPVWVDRQFASLYDD